MIGTLLLGTLLKGVMDESAKGSERKQAGEDQTSANISQARGKREEARDNMFTRNPTGLTGMDVMSPATSKQMQIFNNVVNRYQPQQQTGGMI